MDNSAPVIAAPRPSESKTVRLGKLFGIADQIQALCLARKTAEIRVVNVVPTGRLNIVDGQVVHAAFGARTGLEAAIALINLRDPESEIEPDEPCAERSIALPYLQVLLEAAQRKDESSLVKPTVDESRLLVEYPKLWIILGPRSTDCSLKPGITVVGRDQASDIIIPDPTVSKQHAAIEVGDDGVILRDLDSTNGTYIGGQRITEARVTGRTRLRFGNVLAVLTCPVQK